VPDVLSPNYSGPEKNLADPAMPETFVTRVKDPCPAATQPQQEEPEKIPAVIEKFLRRRKKGLEKLADGNDESLVEPGSSPEVLPE
jgi:hypothetical protein